MKRLILIVALLMLPCICEARDLDDPSILKFYARLNSNTSDYSGYGVADGTFTGEAYSTTPWGQTAANFDGTDDKIAYGNISTGIKSVSFWCNPATTTEQFLEVASGIDIDVASGTIGTTGWTSPSVYVNGALSSTLVALQWQFVTVTSATAVNANATNLGVETTNFGDTDLGEVRFYNVALTQDEIQELYLKQLPQYATVEQPIDTIPDVSDSTLIGAYLNKAVVGGKDLSSNNLDATVNGNPVYLDAGMDFDGTGDYVLTPNFTTTALQDITISFWLNSDNVTSTLRQIEHDLEGGSGSFGTWTAGGGFSILIADENDTSKELSFGSIVTGQWYFAVVTVDGTAATIYLDGESVDTDTLPTGLRGAVTPIEIGSIGYPYDGTIKDVRIYDEAKTASWIANEYAKGVVDDSLVLHVVNGDKDLSRYDHTLTNSGAVLGNGFETTNSSGHIDTGTTFQTTFDGSFTIVTWVKPDDGQPASNDYFWGQVEASATDYIQIRTETDGKLKFQYTSDGDSSTAVTNSVILSDGQQGWYHIIAVGDSTISGVGGLKIYVNGTVQTLAASPNDGDTSGITFADYTINDNLYLNARNNNGSADGFLDGTQKDVRIYNTAKSADWVKEDYNRTKRNY